MSRSADLLLADSTAAAGPSPRSVPMTVASTSSLAHSFCRLGQFSGGTARTMRSCASRDPDFGVRQAVVLERRLVEVHAGADLLAHLADGRAEAARAAVGDGAVQARGRAPAGSRRAPSSR